MGFFRRARLRRKAKRIKSPEIRQARLKASIGLTEEEQVVIIEKNNMVKVLLKAFGSLIYTTVSAILLFLAFVGLVSLVYPEPREAVIAVLREGIQQILEMLGPVLGGLW